ncbi:MAG: substrate-binding domain-containing protein [Solobacterium sp.]|nr:substrate-binding domain-containing protein [Solobacterium sp.]
MLLIFLLILALTFGKCGIDQVITSYNQRYLGHGFEYMNGYSSTDFTGYHVYDDEKLYHLNHEASLIIENEEDMPVLDGAEACYPVYSALALAAYRNIGEIELSWKKAGEEARNRKEFRPEDTEYFQAWIYNGRYVTFSNSAEAYYRLADGIVDMVFAARPSEYQKKHAERQNVRIQTIPIGREAFIFFTEADNPVDNLTSDQIRSVYSGEIANWKELGGKNQKIVAFQRPEDSGSQVTMHYFMGDVPLADPKTAKFVYVGPMGGVVEQVAQYNDEAGALGYTFRYFLTGLNQEENVKILAVDGVYPDMESIRDGTYPVTVDLVCATRADDPDPYVRKMLEFILSDDGQEIIEKTGYAPLNDRNVTPRMETEAAEYTRIYRSEDGIVTMRLADNGAFRLETADDVCTGMLWDPYEAGSDVHDGEAFGGRLHFSAEWEKEKDCYLIAGVDYNETDFVVPEGVTLYRTEE